MSIDPCSPVIRRSFTVICGHLRQRLGQLEDGERRVAELYGLLALMGEAGIDEHLKMARYHASTCRPEEAKKLVNAVLALNPTHRDAWAMKALVSGSQGHLTEFSEAANEAVRWGFEEVPFSFPVLGRA